MFILAAALPIVLIVAASVIALTIVVFLLIKGYNDSMSKSYEHMSDKDILLYINEQPDQIVDSKALERKFGVKKSTCSYRLQNLQRNGVLNMMYNTTMTKGYYTLFRPIDRSYDITLSEEPFMTLEDLLKIFKHYDYKVSIQELLLVTGLPLKVLKREMKYFEKEQIIKPMLKMENAYSYKRIYMLNEPYRSNPDAFLKLENVNFELKEIYQKVVKDDMV